MGSRYDAKDDDDNLLVASQKYEPTTSVAVKSNFDCDELFLVASQTYEESLQKPGSTVASASHWASPKNTERVTALRKSGVPQKTQNQTNWSLAVWSDWAQYQQANLIEGEELLHPLLESFVAMDKEAMAFWLCKFIMEARRMRQAAYLPDTLYST